MTTLKNSPAALALRAELATVRRNLPIVFKAFDPVLKSLDAWVQSVELRAGMCETRLQGLDRMPAPAALDTLLSGAREQ